ncbi:carbohydrate ABC transporter permease [Kineosporia succinea]|uniref:Cellobiose transport system permease protein n=1 Tax=Kineosporia succinea TaxID=84632 RepID=A0ABT9P5F9_9ACTN|nr:sugar ABC transporter permease [Kineosporia succinea]MDP9827654.1 cellobiose transport system permease protein [Kineosporia succinea]
MSDTTIPVTPARTRSPWRSRLSRWDQKGSPYAFVSPFFILFGIFGAFPLLYTFWVSLHAWPLLGEHSFTGLDNYQKLLQDPQFWNAAKNTLGIFVVSTVPQFTLALWLAVTLNRKIRARTLFRIGVIIPNVTSVAAVTLIFGMIFAKGFGLVNWMLGWVGVAAIDWTAHTWSSWLAISFMVDWRWTGYNALIFLAAMQAIPGDLYEAAAIDGASRTRQFWSVTLPLLRPTLIFTTITSIIGGVQLFTEPLLFAPGAGAIQGGTLRQFQTLTMYLIENGFTRFEFGYAGAVAAMIFLLVLIISLINIWLVRRISGAD